MGAKLGGKTGGKYAIGQNADINVTPFVDVMLVLLIIFMVSIPAATTAIKIDLPPATPSANLNNKPLFISITQGGHIYLVSQPTTLETLANDLASRLNVPDPRNETILIRADRDVRYAEFMAVVNQLQQDGFYKVSLITENLT